MKNFLARMSTAWRMFIYGPSVLVRMLKIHADLAFDAKSADDMRYLTWLAVKVFDQVGGPNYVTWLTTQDGEEYTISIVKKQKDSLSTYYAHRTCAEQAQALCYCKTSDEMMHV